MKYLVLTLLYVAEGLPFGFQAYALPLYLYDRGVSLTEIGFTGLLAAPWLAKPLWAPLVDRFGTRKAWILPLQLVMIATCVAAALVGERIGVLLALVFVMNLVAATQDIAVDGLAVDLLGPGELGFGNAAQVAGYKVGMFAGGYLLVVAAGPIGWTRLFLGMAGLVAVILVATAWFRVPVRAAARERATLAAVLRTVGLAVRRHGVLLLVVIATYKLGEGMIDPLWKLFLRSAGYPRDVVLTWTVLYGMPCSIAGSLLGGALAARVDVLRALLVAAVVRVVPLGAEWLIAAYGADASTVLATLLAEEFFGGMLTTVLFAFMMSRTDERIGATHYTLLAAVEVFGKMPGRTLSGALADQVGYAATFATGVALSLGYLALLVGFRRAELHRA